jgi:hypothetical protein
MAHYGAIWVEIAREQYAALPPEAGKQVDVRIEQLLENPGQEPRSAYDNATDQ